MMVVLIYVVQVTAVQIFNHINMMLLARQSILRLRTVERETRNDKTGYAWIHLDWKISLAAACIVCRWWWGPSFCYPGTTESMQAMTRWDAMQPKRPVFFLLWVLENPQEARSFERQRRCGRFAKQLFRMRQTFEEIAWMHTLRFIKIG